MFHNSHHIMVLRLSVREELDDLFFPFQPVRDVIVDRTDRVGYHSSMGRVDNCGFQI